MKRFLACLAILSALAAAAPDEFAHYYVVFLRPDPARKPLAKEEGDRIQSAHMANIRKMADDGQLIAAGPFEDTPTTISGIFVFRLPSLEAAQALAQRDPTVQEHRNLVEVHPWGGPAGIGEEYVRLHKQDPKTPENMQPHPLYLYYRGPAWEEKAATRDAILTRHGAFLMDLRQKGKLGAAGRVEDGGDLLGIVIFRALPAEEAAGLLQQDPGIQAGLFRVEAHRWWSADHVLPW